MFCEITIRSDAWIFSLIYLGVSDEVSEYIRMFLHLISISLTESSYLVFNVWHVKILHHLIQPL